MWLYIPREYCLSSQESVDSIARYGLFFQNVELFVTSSGKPTPRPYSWQGWKTRPWMKLLYGVTLQPSTVTASMDAWIQSHLDFPALTSQSQASKKESVKEHDQDSSFKPAELFAKYSQGIFLSKTSQDCWLTDSCQSYSENFPKWGSMHSGECFRQEMWVAPILEKESSSWPTPCSTEVRQGYQDRSRGKKGSQESLTTVVLKGQQCNNPTGPLAQAKQKNGNASSKNAPTLPQPLKNWETPKVQMGEDCPSERRRNSPNLKSQTAQMATGKKRLNPNFCEWLMGVPLGWSLPTPIDQNAYKLWETESLFLLEQLH